MKYLDKVDDAAIPFVITDIASATSKNLIIVMREESRAHNLYLELKFFFKENNIVYLPSWDTIPYDRVSPNLNITSSRIKLLARMLTEQPKILITSINSILQYTLPKETLHETLITLKLNDKINRDQLIHTLIKQGYNRTESAGDAGEFAVRGSIIDIFTTNDVLGYRLDFIGDVIESIKLYDPTTQISKSHINSIQVFPANEIIFSQTQIENFKNNYLRNFGVNSSNDLLYQAIIDKRKYPGMEHWLPFFYQNTASIFDYMNEAELIFDHLSKDAVNERFTVINDYYNARLVASNKNNDYKPVSPESMWFNKEEWLNKIKLYPSYIFNNFAGDNNITYLPAPSFSSISVVENKTCFTALREYLAKLKIRPKVMVACLSAGSFARMRELLESNDFFTITINNFAEINNISGKSIGVGIFPVKHGVVTSKLLIISEQDLLGEQIYQKRKAKAKIENFLSEAASLVSGEFVVHKEHGIGKFEGLEQVKAAGSTHDCLRIIYEGGDKLYVPVENIELVSKYGSDDNVNLDKLGGVAWQTRKAKLKKRINEIATELIKIAAERASLSSNPIIPIKDIYDSFCKTFPYLETEDQLSAIDSIAEDLASGRPMDRLICGDVGFGKTEVALRAAMMVVATGSADYQVAVIVPTTLLARQHAKTFKERFSGTNVRIAELSRFVSKLDAKRNKELLAKGEIDIVIGTHALLANNINFNNLALVIVDEEQHFGVAQKEKLKKLKSDIHVLTLSATPIPRTLQMSLAGIRELSLIATPPIDRMAVRSFIMPYDPVIIREAILREHYRGGRIFYVAPKISDLEEIAANLRSLVPEVKIVIAHGQMPSTELDNIMNDFYDGKYNILISTAIIESGLDIANANTMIIHNADKFGLSQLYQMRGRVGRGKIRAYAYLTTRPGKILSDIAIKRLTIMERLDNLGAGFSLASHDMDIRGFGNLVGAEQSGHIKEVGIELYQEMLNEAVLSLKDEIKCEDFTPQLNLNLPVLIPEDYIADLGLRLNLYKRASNLKTASEIDSFSIELIDRFGNYGEEVKYLLEVLALKLSCKQLKISKIDAGPKGILISFLNDELSNPDKLIFYVNSNPLKMKIRPDSKLFFVFESEDISKRLNFVKSIIANLTSIL